MGKITGEQLARAAIGALDMNISYQKEDCQAFVEQSVKRAGGSMKDYAGSNDMYRNACSVIYPIDKAKANGVLQPGALLFIVAQDGGEPEKYKADGLGNGSHVGIYTKDPKAEVVHSSASRGGVFPSTLKNGWTHAGLSNEIDYPSISFVEETEYGGKGGKFDMGEERLQTIILPDESAGETVNLRKSTSMGGIVLAKIRDGTQVLAGDTFESDDGKEWKQVKYNGITGYVLAQYVIDSIKTEQEEAPTDYPETLQKSFGEILDSLEKRVANIEKITGIRLEA